MSVPGGLVPKVLIAAQGFLKRKDNRVLGVKRIAELGNGNAFDQRSCIGLRRVSVEWRILCLERLSHSHWSNVAGKTHAEGCLVGGPECQAQTGFEAPLAGPEHGSVAAVAENPCAVIDRRRLTQGQNLCRQHRRVALHLWNRVREIQVPGNPVSAVFGGRFVFVPQPEIHRQPGSHLDVIVEEWRVGIDHQAARRDVLRTRATVERAQQESGPGGSAEQRVRLYESVGRELRPEVKVGEVRILDQAELAPVLQTELHLVLALNMREFGAETDVFGVLDPVETVADRGIADIQSWIINLRQVLDIGRVPATRPEASEIARVNLDIRRIIIIVDRAVAAADVKHRRRADHIHALAIRI